VEDCVQIGSDGLFKKKKDVRLEELDSINKKLKEVIKAFEEAVNKISEIEENIALMKEQIDKLYDEKKGNDMMVQ
jgi:exonuclease VII small subunit